MLKHFPLLALSLIALVVTGCRSRPKPDLYEPGDIPTWRTVKTTTTDEDREERPRVVISTSLGPVTVELFPEQAPVSTDNFLQYVTSRHYDGTIFHRVIPGFMVQGGGFTAGMAEKQTNPPIVNESGNGLANRRGTLAMARTNDPNSATSQFFINLVDNAFLDGGRDRDGYAVFGRVVDGMSIVDQIANVPTASKGEFDDVPVEPVVITTIRQVR